MHVVMTFAGGPMDGKQEFEDDARLALDGNVDVKLVIARMLYDHTEKGQVGRFSQGFTHAVYRLLQREEASDDITLAGYKYLIVNRTKDPIDKTISIVANYIT